MIRRLRSLCLSVMALSLALAITGCDNGGGGGSQLLRLFFGLNGLDDCTRVVVEIDLEAANAALDEDETGELQCLLNAGLAASGCIADFELRDDGATFRATIDNCTVPGVSALFSCDFTQGTVDSIRSFTTVICDCNEPNCDENPDICIDGNPDPTSCEDCTDGIDNDGDGKTDCEDPTCQDDPACGTTLPTTSTSTTTLSSTTTTTTQSSTTTSSTIQTTTSTTTSTTVPLNLTCNLTFRLVDDVELGSLQWDTDYSAAPGVFVGSAGGVECATLIDGSIAEFNDQEESLTLTSGIISLAGFTGPVDVSECTFRASTDPVAEDFVITVVDAADPTITPVQPLPDVEITGIRCQGPTTSTLPLSDTTTTTTTSTTIIGPTLTTTTTTTTLEPPGGDQLLTFSVPDTLSGVGAVQFTVDYTNAPGDFALAPNNVDPDCAVTGNVGGFGAFGDDTGARELTGGAISLAGFDTPASVATCTFESTGSVSPSDFTIVVTDASFANLDPISPLPAVTVTVAPVR